VFNGYVSTCTASVVIDTFSVMLTGQTNSRSVFSRTGLVNSRTSHLANNEFLKITENTTTCTNTNNNKNILKRHKV